MAVPAPRPTLEPGGQTREQGRGSAASRRSGGSCGAPSAARRRTSRRCSPCTGRAPTATAWLVVHDAAAAEDIAQEAFIAALRALDRFDRRRPFGPWLSRIVVNRAIDWARARRLQAVPAESVAPAAPGRRAGRRRSSIALRSLPVDQRAVVVLRHGLGYTPGEIARMLELPRGTVNSRAAASARPPRDAARRGTRWSLSASTSCCSGPAPGEAAARERARVRVAAEFEQRPVPLRGGRAAASSSRSRLRRSR